MRRCRSRAIVELTRTSDSELADEVLRRLAFEIMALPYDAEPEEIESAYSLYRKALRPLQESDSNAKDWFYAIKNAYQHLQKAGYVN